MPAARLITLTQSDSAHSGPRHLMRLCIQYVLVTAQPTYKSRRLDVFVIQATKLPNEVVVAYS